MRKLSFVVITLIVVFAILHLGEALDCYTCNSNKDCEDPSEEKYKQPCFTNMCRKCVKTFENGTQVYERGCAGIVGMGAHETNLSQAIVVEQVCSFCNTDMCNNADAVSINKIALESLVMLWTARFVLTNSY